MHGDSEGVEDGPQRHRIGLRDGLGEVASAGRELLDGRRPLAGFTGLSLSVLLAAAAAALASRWIAHVLSTDSRAVFDGWIFLVPTMLAFAVAVGTHAVADRPDGDPVRLRSAAGATLRRWRPLALWGLLSVPPLVAMGWIAIRIGERPVFDPAGTGDPALWFLFAAVSLWSVPTYFVVPVIAFERRGFLASVRRGVGLSLANAPAVVSVQATVAVGLFLAVLVAFVGGLFAFAGAGALAFVLPIGLIYLLVGLAVLALAAGLLGLVFGVHCSVRYRCYDRVR